MFCLAAQLNCLCTTSSVSWMHWNGLTQQCCYLWKPNCSMFQSGHSWGDHWLLSWSIRIFCAGLAPVTWTSVAVCWWNWLSHVYDIYTLPGCGCSVCCKTCNKQILWIPLSILSIYFSIWRDNKLQFLIHTSLKILKVLLMKLKEILNKRPKIRCHTEQRKLRSSICGKTYRREGLSAQQCTLQ
jgi:hypothetical protein